MNFHHGANWPTHSIIVSIGASDTHASFLLSLYNSSTGVISFDRKRRPPSSPSRTCQKLKLSFDYILLWTNPLLSLSLQSPTNCTNRWVFLFKTFSPLSSSVGSFFFTTRAELRAENGRVRGLCERVRVTNRQLLSCIMHESAPYEHVSAFLPEKGRNQKGVPALWLEYNNIAITFHRGRLARNAKF